MGAYKLGAGEAEGDTTWIGGCIICIPGVKGTSGPFVTVSGRQES
jgi:hypothetical protein